ncbi:MAG: transglutaminase domain-containing protein [Terracidiphilus sp.]|jgi:hypothetical protein
MRFRPLLHVAVLAVAVAAPRVSFAQFQAPTDAELKMTADPKAPGADAVYLYREEMQDDNLGFRTVYERIKVLTEKGKELATVRLSYQRRFSFGDRENDRDIENHANDVSRETGGFEIAAISGRTIHADGTVIPMTTTAADLVDVKKGGNQMNTMTFNLPSVEVGSILEYRYQLRLDVKRFLMPPPLWQVQQPYYVHKAHFRFTPNTLYAPSTQASGIGGGYMTDGHGQALTDLLATPHLPNPKSLARDPLGNYQLDVADVPAIPKEAYAPPLESQIQQVNFYYSATFVQKEYWQRQMQYWLKDANQYTNSSGAVKNAADELTSGAGTPLDKAKKLYDVVQKLENTDYSSKSGFRFYSSNVPAGSVDKVLENKSGDSMQIALLYLALVRAAGLNARPERIASRDRHIFTVDFLNDNQLDAVVVGITIDGKEIVVDPGEKFAPFQTLGWAHSGAGGVAMTADGKIETVFTPVPPNTDNTQVRVGKLTVNPDGTVAGTLRVGFVGQEALHWRQLALKTEAANLNQEMEHLLRSKAPDGVELHLDRIAALDDPTKQLVAVVTVTGPLATHAGSHLVLPRLFFDTKTANPFPSADVRMLPVDMHYPAQEQEQITYVLPAGYAVEGTPADANTKWLENAAYQLRSKVDAGTITTVRILARGFTMLDAKDYGALRNFYDQVAVSDRQQIVLTMAKAGGQ